MAVVERIFEEFGGPAEVGRALGIPTEHAAQMKRRDSIPSRHWATLIEAARTRGFQGVTYEALALHRAARKDSAEVAA